MQRPVLCRVQLLPNERLRLYEHDADPAAGEADALLGTDEQRITVADDEDGFGDRGLADPAVAFIDQDGGAAS